MAANKNNVELDLAEREEAFPGIGGLLEQVNRHKSDIIQNNFKWCEHY